MLHAHVQTALAAKLESSKNADCYRSRSGDCRLRFDLFKSEALLRRLSAPVPLSKALRHGKSLARGLILPHPAQGCRAISNDEPLVVAGMFCTGSGLGRAAQGCYKALQSEGLSPIAVDLSEMFHQVDSEAGVPLAPFPVSKRGTVILFANPPEVERALMGLGLRRWHAWNIIGAWVWELPIAPAAWQRQAVMMSEIWAPSRYAAAAFSPQYDRPVKVVPHHVPVSADTAKPKASHLPLRILAIADARSSLERKNLLTAIRMFRAAFDSDERVELIAKCRNLSLFPAHAAKLKAAAHGDARIHLLDQTLDAAGQDALIQSADILLSPHRSEGFGLNLAEAMAAGKCVIATGWSGNVDFMPEGAATLLPFTLVPVVDSTGVYLPEENAMWAEPEFEAGIAALKALAADAEMRSRMGERARAAISELLGTRQIRNALLHVSQRS